MFYWVLLGFTRFYWILLGFYQIGLGWIGFLSGFCGFHWLQRVFGREVGPVSTRINPIDNDLIEFYFFFLPGLTVIDQEVQSAVPAHGTSRPLNLDGRISWGISDLRPALRFFFGLRPSDWNWNWNSTGLELAFLFVYVRVSHRGQPNQNRSVPWIRKKNRIQFVERAWNSRHPKIE